MQKIFFLSASIFLIFCLVSCKKSNDSLRVLIGGKWNLQRHHIVAYFSGIKASDTTYMAPDLRYYTQFNMDGSFENVKPYGTTKGDYLITGTKIEFFNFQNLGGGVILTPEPLVFTGGSTTGYNFSDAAKIVLINSGNLTIHAEVTASPGDYKFIIDQYYTR